MFARGRDKRGKATRGHADTGGERRQQEGHHGHGPTADASQGKMGVALSHRAPESGGEGRWWIAPATRLAGWQYE